MSELTQQERDVINAYVDEFLKTVKEIDKAIKYAVKYYQENEQAIVNSERARRAAAAAYHTHIQRYMDELDDPTTARYAELRAERKKLLQERDDAVIARRHEFYAYTVCQHLIDQLSDWYHAGRSVSHCGVILTPATPASPCARFIKNAKRSKYFLRGIEMGIVTQNGQRSGDGLLNAGFVLEENFDKTKFNAVYTPKPLEVYAPVLVRPEGPNLHLCKNTDE